MREQDEEAERECKQEVQPDVLHEAQRTAMAHTEPDLEKSAPVGASSSRPGTRSGEKRAAEGRLGEPMTTSEDVERRVRKRLRAAACLRVASIAEANSSSFEKRRKHQSQQEGSHRALLGVGRSRGTSHWKEKLDIQFRRCCSPRKATMVRARVCHAPRSLCVCGSVGRRQHFPDRLDFC